MANFPKTIRTDMDLALTRNEEQEKRYMGNDFINKFIPIIIIGVISALVFKK